MQTLKNYNAFTGRHWETGSVHNYFAYRGVKAPHTNEPFTEAMLMGISGGAVMGYFSFAYKGYDPHVAILTRNTFDPLNTMLERLGIVQEIKQTSKPEKGVTNLIDTLEEGVPAIIWADYFTLPYNGIPFDAGMWAIFPIVVYGYDEAVDTVHIADRANVPLTITTEELAMVRGRVKKDKFRVMTLDRPDPDKLVTAVQKGIWDCIKLFTEAPPKGSKNNFGLQAYEWWIKLLTKPKQRLSWAKEFPPGQKMYAGLTSTFDRIALFGSDGTADAERNLYADFLDEASLVLSKPALKDAATQFRQSGQAWEALGEVLLPDHVLPFRETRELMLRKHTLFIEQGQVALDDILAINEKLDAIKHNMATAFPLEEEAVIALREKLAAHVAQIRDIETEAVAVLQDAMG